MSANFVTSTELDYLVQQRYPGVPYDEAYLCLFNDMKPFINAVAGELPSVVEALGILLNMPSAVFAVSIGRIAQRILEATSQDTTGTSQPAQYNPNDISDQMTIQILRNLAATAGEPSSIEAGASFSGVVENVIEHRIGGVSGGPIRTFKILSNAFNAGPEFTAVFATCVLAGTVLVALQTRDELRAIGLRLGDIRDELSYQTTAMVQGWQTQGFGAFIYWFLDNEIHKAGGEQSVGRHAFYVYNRTTSANEVFEKLVREKSFPASFGGMSSDLEVIFFLMWQNRQSLRQTDPENADNVVFHLLVPAKRTFAMPERMAINDGVGKLIIKGHTDEGACYAWFNFVRVPEQVVLHDIGNLDTDSADLKRMEEGIEGSRTVFAGFCLGTVISGFVFPPAGPYFASLTCASWAAAAKYVDNLRRFSQAPLRILGPPPGYRQE
ncbi:hypothetical protein AbraIFM66951_000806 [Aspergillus brasiliensis]|uniref:Uncharacterized protein n=1 Tax=Aspergillus brasiliensis TaxID=319629 RepID=A0A9W6DN40_9EURO|nr:hypothetical protein AbraCBS73388_006981 [Aspergillus brasiliensis]GKZ48721.1 hypothetical protein AbraIFM66951_000806 [Aspergillus brasiliensis]